MAQTEDQKYRQRFRGDHGRYEEVARCEWCGKRVGVDYCSDPRCNTMGYGLTLHDKCAAVVQRIPDAEYADAFLKREGGIQAAAGYIRYERRSRLTGTLVRVYDTQHPENVFDPEGGRYVASCEEHGTLCNFRSLTAARAHAPVVDWCEACQRKR